MDLTTLTDEELDALRIELATELERRDRIKGIPAMIADLTRNFENSGGKIEKLEEAFENAKRPRPVPPAPQPDEPVVPEQDPEPEPTTPPKKPNKPGFL